MSRKAKPVSALMAAPHFGPRQKDAVNYSSLHIFKTSAPILDFNKVFDNYTA
jgi:hypothetical protein